MRANIYFVVTLRNVTFVVMNTCKQCGAETSGQSLYCSDKCRQKAYRKRISLIVQAARQQGVKVQAIAHVYNAPKLPDNYRKDEPKQWKEAVKPFEEVKGDKPIQRDGESYLDYRIRVEEWREGKD